MSRPAGVLASARGRHDAAGRRCTEGADTPCPACAGPGVAGRTSAALSSMTRTLRPGPASSPSARLSSAPISRSKPTRPARAGQGPHLLHRIPQRLPARSQNAQRALLGRRARSQGHVRVPRPSSHCLAGACACAPAAAHTATRRSARLALPSPAHVSATSSSKQARRTEVARVRVCNALSAHNSEAESGRANDVHALTQQQAVHVDGPGGAVIRQDVGQLAGALHHVRKRRPARRARRAPLCPGCTLRARQAGAAYQRVQLCWPVRSRRPQVCSM